MYGPEEMDEKGGAMLRNRSMEEPDPVRKYESEGRSGFDYGTCIRTDIVRNKLLFIVEKG